MPIIAEGIYDLLQRKNTTIVIPVNCVGVMGNGLALAAKMRYAGLMDFYVNVCNSGELKVGRPVHALRGKESILLFPTKDHWRNDSQIEWIDSGLKFIADHHEKLSIKSLAIPMLGCGKGNLSWDSVRPLIYKHFETSPVEVTICAC